MAKAESKSSEARVLLDYNGHKCDEIVTGDVAALGVAEGWADGDPEAVKYAKSLASSKDGPEAPTPREKRDALAEEPSEDVAG